MSEVGGLVPYEDSRAQQEEERLPLSVWQELSQWETVTMKSLQSNSQFLQGILCSLWGFLNGSDSKQSTYNAGGLGLILGSGRSPGRGNGYSLQYSCLENSMNREALLYSFSPFLKEFSSPFLLGTYMWLAIRANPKMKSSLIPNKPIFAWEITSSLFILGNKYILLKLYSHKFVD